MEEKRLVLDCPLCEHHELQISNTQENLQQCINCGYSTSEEFGGSRSTNEAFSKLDEDMKEWAKEINGYIWIPSVVNLSVGLYYPFKVDGEMKWAMAPLVDIPEDQQKDYPKENGDGFHTKRYNIENQLIFDDFGGGIKKINDTLDKLNSVLDRNKSVKDA